MIFIKKSKEIFLSAMLCFALLSFFNCNSFMLIAAEPDGSAPCEGLPEGCILIEGDILVPEISTRGLFATNWWPNGVIPYVFNGNVSAANRALAIEAMAEWEMVANIVFQNGIGTGDYIYIQNHASANNSWVGVQGGMQIVNIHNWNEFTIVHELGHTLGLWHEQSRADRDAYVTINLALIAPGDRHNFDIHSEAYMIGPYNFDSIMHYGQCAFSICGNTDCRSNPDSCRTMTVNPAWSYMQDLIGQRDHLSDLDQISMWMMYPPDNTVFVDKYYGGTIENGTLIWPLKTFNDGYTVVPDSGTIVIKPGSYHETGLYTKAVTLMAPLGGVVLGE